MKRTLLMMPAALALSGCLTYTELAQKDCSAYGFAPGSREYSYCVERQANARQVRFQQALSRVRQHYARYQQPRNLLTCFHTGSYTQCR